MKKYISLVLFIIEKILNCSSNDRFVNYLRKQGVAVGENVIFRGPYSTTIDTGRAHLISIGNNVDINTHFCLMTHDFSNFVFRNYFSDYVNNCGEINIGNNIYIGTNVTILRGVSIGDNCIIGAGSVVTKDIPSNSVAVGVPCRVVSSLEAYYEKRKEKAKEEAATFVRCFRKRYGRDPLVSELREEWITFIDSSNMDQYPEIPIKQKIGKGFTKWCKTYKAPYHSYEEFMNSVKD